MGKLIIFPTDTVYGIGCEIFDLENIKKIYSIKNRPLDKPLACLCADLEQINQICELNDKAKILIKEFLPGPLTLILKAQEKVEKMIGYKTIGVRIPDCEVALDILKEHGPMLTTSVNDSGKTPINEYGQIVNEYADLVDEIYKPTSNSSNLSSTVVNLTNDKVEVLRQGAITLLDINKVLNV